MVCVLMKPGPAEFELDLSVLKILVLPCVRSARRVLDSSVTVRSILSDASKPPPYVRRKIVVTGIEVAPEILAS